MISIGTDCSGIEAPIEALKQLNVPFQHKWSCEIDKFARKSMMANYEPEIVYTDITQRDHSQLPDVDLYVCGFPCQSFSSMGKKLGTRDPRGNIMQHCIDVIKTKLPNVFILENVKNFKFIENGQPYEYLLKSLDSIKSNTGKSVYNVYADMYNTKDYGIPQHRERLYVIGIIKDIQLHDFTKPDTCAKPPLDNFITDKSGKEFNVKDQILYNKMVNNTLKNTILTPFNFCCPPVEDECPTLTTQCSRFYLTKYKRVLNIDECLLLQGFSDFFVKVVSNSQLCKQIGNSMSVNVLCAILKQVFEVTLYK